ncbi:MAG: ribonuclease HI [Rickettsiales bacterium]|jgi:ribonuclease HI|nr:ribonuclease HI [Rickettsiales bacterium]
MTAINEATEDRTIIIYTDGACSGNPGVGGWGVLMKCGKHMKKMHGGDIYTTNNRMELTAVIEALGAIGHNREVKLYTDSQYVKNGITEWIKKWKKNGWKNSKKEDVANRDLWQKLDSLTEQHHIAWFWVKGHSDNEMNTLVDGLAKAGIRDIAKPQTI